MGEIIKQTDVLSRQIKSYAPTLQKFFSDDELIELLKRGDALAQALETRVVQQESDFKQKMHNISVETEQAKKQGYEEGLLQSKTEIREQLLQEFSDFITFMEETRIEIEKGKASIYDESKEEIARFCIAISEKIIIHQFSVMKNCSVKHWMHW